MKHFIKIFVIISLVISFIITPFSVQAELNSREKANLIEKYLVGHKENIIAYTTKYKFLNDSDIQSNLAKIDILINSLDKIQKTNDILVEEKVISIILEEIKVVNEDLKNLLNLKKAKYDKVLQSQKDVYQTLGKQLGLKINSLYSLLSPSLSKIKNPTEKEQKLKSILEVLNLLSKDIQNFKSKNFDTIEDMQSYFLRDINGIKYYMLVLKETLNK